MLEGATCPRGWEGTQGGKVPGGGHLPPGMGRYSEGGTCPRGGKAQGGEHLPWVERHPERGICPGVERHREVGTCPSAGLMAALQAGVASLGRACTSYRIQVIQALPREAKN